MIYNILYLISFILTIFMALRSEELKEEVNDLLDDMGIPVIFLLVIILTLISFAIFPGPLTIFIYNKIKNRKQL